MIPGAVVAAGQQNGALAAYIQQRQFSRNPRQQADLPRQVHGVKGPVASSARSAEPDFVSLHRPSQSLDTVPALGKGCFLTEQIDNRHRTAVIARLGMVNECNHIAFG